MYYIILLYKKYIVLSNFFFYSSGKALAVLKERGHEEFALLFIFEDTFEVTTPHLSHILGCRLQQTQNKQSPLNFSSA